MLLKNCIKYLKNQKTIGVRQLLSYIKMYQEECKDLGSKLICKRIGIELYTDVYSWKGGGVNEGSC